MLKKVFMTLSVLAAVGICLLTEAFSGLKWLWLLPVGFVGSYLILLLLTFIFVLIMAAAVDMKKVQEKDSFFYRSVCHAAMTVVLPLLRVRVHYQGLEQTPPQGCCLVVCNHIFDLDPVFLLEAFREKRLTFIAKREVMDMFIAGPFLHKMRGQPINRENDREALKTILNCVRLIKEDNASVAVFPEGYVSVDRKLHPFRNGVFKIALKTNVPIVVCTLRNTQHVLHNAMRLKPTDVYMHLVGVIEPKEFQGSTAVQIGERVHKMMAEDLGPDLVLQT